MSPMDIIILVLVAVIVIGIGYFVIWKNRNKGCQNCPYAKNCGGNCNTKQKK